MSGSSLYKPSSSIIEKSHVNRETYEKMYEESINDPSLFWWSNVLNFSRLLPPILFLDFEFLLLNLDCVWVLS